MDEALKKVHVVFVLNDAPFFLSHRVSLAHALCAHGIRVTLVAPAHPEAQAKLAALGIHFCPWSVSRRGTNPFGEVASLASLTTTLRSLRPDLIHNVTQKPVLYGSCAARVAGIKRVVNAISGLGYAFTEGTGGGGKLGTMMLAMHRICHSASGTRTVFQNPDDKSTFVSRRIVPETQARLILGSGVNPDLHRPAHTLASNPRIILPARMLADKGVGEAIAAVRHLKAHGHAVEMQLAGGIDAGNPAAIPVQRIRDWSTEGYCTWLGHVTDMLPCFQQARICCLPSYREGLPKALIEAASCGLPIITCDVPGCREIVRHGDNGLLVPPRDPQALAAALKTLLDDYDLCVRMGRRGRERVIAEFSLDLVVRQHLEIYRELLGERWPG